MNENLFEIIGKDIIKDNFTIFDSFVKADAVINNPDYKSIVCSVSGGADSDIMLDLCHKVDVNKKIYYVWFDTGLEYGATKEHIKKLEEKYNITIHREKPKKSIPTVCKNIGQPFISKHASEMLQRLQKHNFKFEDKPFDELYAEYPKCKSALRWWCNTNPTGMGIDQRRNLKEFLVANPPTFKISAQCCYHAKKKVAHDVAKKYNADLMIIGVRKAEGGIRRKAYKNCYDIKEDKMDQYRPLFWYEDEDKAKYEKVYGITHSKCYTEYGLKRTGCVGCPYGKHFEFELEILRQFEPNYYTAVCNIFKESYEYTRKYKEFVNQIKAKEKKGVNNE